MSGTAVDPGDHLCNSCNQEGNFPECLPDKPDVTFGNGLGNDNIVYCYNYSGPFEERA
jgi:hypothetical protein